MIGGHLFGLADILLPHEALQEFFSRPVVFLVKAIMFMTLFVNAEIQVSAGRPVKYFPGLGRHSLIECSRKLVMALTCIVRARDPVVVGSDVRQDLWDAIVFVMVFVCRAGPRSGIGIICGDVRRRPGPRRRQRLRDSDGKARGQRLPTRRARQRRETTPHGLSGAAGEYRPYSPRMSRLEMLRRSR